MNTSPAFFIPNGTYTADDVVSELRKLACGVSQIVGSDIKVRRFIDLDCAWDGEWFRIEVTQSPRSSSD